MRRGGRIGLSPLIDRDADVLYSGSQVSEELFNPYSKFPLDFVNIPSNCMLLVSIVRLVFFENNIPNWTFRLQSVVRMIRKYHGSCDKHTKQREDGPFTSVVASSENFSS